MSESAPGIDAELLDLFRNPSAFIHAAPGTAGVDELMAAADRHGITALLAERLAGVPPSPLLERLVESTRRHAAWELGHRRALLDALAALTAAGIEPVLFKGTALAYSVYANPVLRIRGDTDLLVPANERQRVTTALVKCGFAPETAVESGQTSFVSAGPGGSQGLDVHWQVNNSALLSRLFTYEELRAEAVPLTALGPNALAASPVHALLLACMHLGSHRHNPYYVSGEAIYGGDRLIWLYDLHLLAQAFSDRDWQSFVARAETKGLLGACADGLTLSRTCFGTEVPEPAWNAMASPRAREPASDYLRGGRWTQQWLDLRAQPGLRGRSRYLRELVFPPAEYMRSRYADEPRPWLPWLYARRALAGTWRRLRGPRT
jgi:hypothetical protein